MLSRLARIAVLSVVAVIAASAMTAPAAHANPFKKIKPPKISLPKINWDKVKPKVRFLPTAKARGGQVRA